MEVYWRALDSSESAVEADDDGRTAFAQLSSKSRFSTPSVCAAYPAKECFGGIHTFPGVSVCQSAQNSVPTRRIFMKFDLWIFFSKICRENSSPIKIWQKYPVLYMKTDTHFVSYLAQFLLEWEMFQTNVVEKIKTHILCSVMFLRKSCRLWDNVGKYGRLGQATGNIRRMRSACRIPKATDTHSEYVILIAFPLQQWLREGTSILRHTYVAYIIFFIWSV